MGLLDFLRRTNDTSQIGLVEKVVTRTKHGQINVRSAEDMADIGVVCANDDCPDNWECLLKLDIQYERNLTCPACGCDKVYLTAGDKIAEERGCA